MKDYQKQIEINETHFLSNRSLKRTIIIHGVLAAISYIAFFLIMRAFNLLHVTELRFVNYAILGFVSYHALSDIRKTARLNYFQDFGAAFMVGIVSFLLLAIFLYIYLMIDASFSEYVTSTAMGGGDASPTSPSEISIMLFFEGSAMSAVITLCVMQLFKRFLDKE